MPLVNLYFAWVWMLAGMLSGAVIGMLFHRADWLGGFDSWRRRMVRLGHIAFLGTGLLNLGFALSVDRLGGPPESDAVLTTASVLFIAGAVTMPVVCFASAWRERWRHLFVIPVISLVAAVALLLARGLIE
jgi:hypothetical protein